MSHTVTAKVKFTFPGANKDAPLAKAVVKAGGKLLGLGKHKLFAGSVDGFGFTLPEWRYPLVLTPGGELKFDDYNGSWGNRKDIEKITSIYGIEAAREAANTLGWQVQDQPNGSIQVFHPSGGMVTVGVGGEVDATGFVGISCEKATEPLVAAMGGKDLEQRKAEYFVEHANVQQTDGGGNT